ncbi:hypothetical protein PI125_g27229 [Phytophthora idaei]|nr:hypothetical protein PI125_g27229 [Phytophthora idaei]KAG3111220.1 hypothetical protein PI126_g24825 [Phytophthora idaei]
MALLKHLFLEFVYHQEKTQLAFAERGCQVISVIPFELPQAMPSAQPPSPPVAQESPPTTDAATEQQRVGCTYSTICTELAPATSHSIALPRHLDNTTILKPFARRTR